jgi:hypothetical protein
MDNFNRLIDLFSKTGNLGDFDAENKSITLYDVKNISSVMKRLKADVTAITPKYKWIVLSPGDNITNVKILDIDL